MKAATLKRLTAVEAALNAVTRPRLVLLDVHDMDPADRDAYRDGDDGVLSRYGVDPTVATPYIRAIIVDAASDGSDPTADMDDDELDAYERKREREERRREAEARERRQLTAIRSQEDRSRAVVGWDRDGKPVYDDAVVSANWNE